MVSEV
jgi:hypothetical protein